MRTLTIFFLVFLFLLPATADELWVRNRPFKGQTAGAGAAMAAELQALAKALEIPLQESADGWIAGEAGGPAQAGHVLINSQSIPITDGMVSVKSFVTAAGGVVKPNRDLGTVDVYLTSKTQAASGDWSAGATEEPSSSTTGNVFRSTKGGYTLKLSPGVVGTNNPELADAVMADALKENPGLGSQLQNSKIDYFFANQDKSKAQAIGMVMLIPSPPVPEGTPDEAILQGIRQRGGKLLERPSSVTLNGAKFFQISYLEERNGVAVRNEGLFHFGTSHPHIHSVMVVGPQADFEKASGPLLKTARSVKIHP